MAEHIAAVGALLHDLLPARVTDAVMRVRGRGQGVADLDLGLRRKRRGEKSAGQRVERTSPPGEARCGTGRRMAVRVALCPTVAKALSIRGGRAANAPVARSSPERASGGAGDLPGRNSRRTA